MASSASKLLVWTTLCAASARSEASAFQLPFPSAFVGSSTSRLTPISRSSSRRITAERRCSALAASSTPRRGNARRPARDRNVGGGGGGGRGGGRRRQEGRRRRQRRSSYGEDDDPFGDYADVGGGYGGHEPYDEASDRNGFEDYDDDDDDDSRADDDDPIVGDPGVANDDFVVVAERSKDGGGGGTAALPGAHFYSRKPLTDPTFSIGTDGGGDDDGIFERLCEGAGIDRPSRIQSLAWPVLLEGKNALIADQTGSGKTLAYLMPLLQRTVRGEGARRRPNGAPSILILAPTAELAEQIHDVCLRLSRTVPFRTSVVTASGRSATSIRDQIRTLRSRRLDVLVSTPGRIATILRSKNSGLDLTSLRSIVLDEVDVLLIDETFGPQLRTVGAAAPVDRTQFVFVTATLPDSIVETVEREFPGVATVKGPGLHRVAPTVKEHLVDVSVPSASNKDKDLCFDVKAKQLMKALRQNRCERTLIFCNTVEACRDVENLLKRNDRKARVSEVLSYHNAMTPEARNRSLAAFSRGGRKKKGRNEGDGGGAAARKRKRKRDDDVDRILVCTDRAARGVDFDAAPVGHVVLFDFPRDPAEYVRRVGRTARAGRKGVSTVFAYGWQLPIARKIMGSKLESFTVAADDGSDGGDDEYRGGVQGRKKRTGGRSRRVKKEKEAMIKGNIEGGRMWKGDN